MNELISKYSPVWIFHPEETVYPMCIDKYVSLSNLKLSNGDIISTEDFTNWVNSTPIDEQVLSTLVPRLQEMKEDEPLTCPTYVFYVERGDDLYISYYLFYKSNPFPCCGYHDADLEHVQVHLHNRELKRVYYSKHSGGNWVDRANVLIENDKPVVYVAHGSHACYERAGVYLRIVPDWTGNGRKFIATRHELIEGALLYCGDYGNGHVSGFPQKSNWLKEDIDEPWRC